MGDIVGRDVSMRAWTNVLEYGELSCAVFPTDIHVGAS